MNRARKGRSIGALALAALLLLDVLPGKPAARFFPRPFSRRSVILIFRLRITPAATSASCKRLMRALIFLSPTAT